MQWASVNERGDLKWATAFVQPGEGQPGHTHPEAQELNLATGRVRVQAPSIAGDFAAPNRFLFLPGETHSWVALEPSLVFTLWQKPPAGPA